MATKGRTILITGAGRGLGLEWARQELADGATVIAAARRPAEAEGLRDLARGAAGAALVTLPMDVTDDASVEAGAREVETRFGSLDDLVLNAGIYGPRGDQACSAPPDEVRRVLEVNVLGPYRVTRAFLPLLRKTRAPRVLFVTSRMGSIGDAPGGSSYAYRMSKSALNMLGANLASDLRDAGVLCLLLHPGWVRTGMGGERAPLAPAESIAGLRRVVKAAGPAQSGSFFDYSGAAVPW
jgi:NAD(P)-dependent dehydrogenase (short-subunit alcohol dehydrogenase family)